MPSHFFSVGCYSDRQLNVDLCSCFLCISPKLDLGFTTGLNFAWSVSKHHAVRGVQSVCSLELLFVCFRPLLLSKI